MYGNKAKRKTSMLHVILKPEFYWVTTVLWFTADSSHLTASRCAVQAWASCSVRTATVDWILKLYLWTLIKSTIVFSTQFPSFRHQDLSSSYHKTTNNSTLHKTADVFPVTFSHPVFRHGATISSFFVTKRQLWVYLSSSFSSADSSQNSDNVNNDEVHFYSAWFYWLECSERWGRLFFSKEKLIDRKTEKVFGRHEKLRCTVSPQTRSVRIQVRCETSAECRRGICFPDCLW